MSKYTKSVGKDKGGLHFKMVADTTETKRYAKRIKQEGPASINNFLLHIMTEQLKETQKKLRSYNYSSSNSRVWTPKGGDMSPDMSMEKATVKIAESLVVKKTRDGNTDQSTASVSMWSQDQENPNNFTSAGVRGSRARSGKKYAGKIAQYYEGGRTPFDGGALPDHPGFPKIGYMAEAKGAIEDKYIDGIDNHLENTIGVDGSGASQTASITSKRQVTDADIKTALKYVSRGK